MLALLYDVHGNLPALEAVLADASADRYLLGSDYAVGGAWPVETVDRLRELEPATWIAATPSAGWWTAPTPGADSSADRCLPRRAR